MLWTFKGFVVRGCVKFSTSMFIIKLRTLISIVAEVPGLADMHLQGSVSAEAMAGRRGW